MLLESLLLAGAGGALGLGLARWSLDALLAVAPTNLLGVSELFIDRRVLIYAFGLSLATGAIAGLASTIVFRAAIDDRRIADARIEGRSRARVRQALVVVQVAMTVVLLCGAGVLLRTLIALDRAPMGFDAHDVLTMRVAISPGRYPDERPRAFYREALTRLARVAGHRIRGCSGKPADDRHSSRWGRGFTSPARRNRRPTRGRRTVVRMVGPGIFPHAAHSRAAWTRFTDADNESPMAGFVVNETFARTLLRDAIRWPTSISVG